MSFIARRTLANPLYTASKLWLYGRSRLAIRADDVLIALYPKTGSTWLRFILYHYFSQRQDTASFDEVNSHMPEYGHPSLLGRWPFEPVPRLIKTHQRYSPLFGDTRVILAVRDPRDIMISMYHYASAKRPREFDGTLHDLLLHPRIGLRPFFEHFRTWAPRAGLRIRYEDLKADTAGVVGQILNFIGVPTDEARLARAITLSSVVNIRKAQQVSRKAFRGYDRRFVFARAATSKQWVDQFGADERECYRQFAEQYGFDLYPQE